MKIGAIIQARTGSRRLPEKVFLKLPSSGTKTILDHIISRLPQEIETVIATTDLTQDDVIVQAYPTAFRGDENNVLVRFYQCAKKHGFDQIIRLTADNPIIDTNALNETLTSHIKNDSDYTTSVGLPLGCNFEVFKFSALEQAYLNATSSTDLEHVTKYIKNNPAAFKLNQKEFNFQNSVRLTVDYQSDYDLMDKIFSGLGDQFSLAELDEFLSKFPELIKINESNEQTS